MIDRDLFVGVPLGTNGNPDHVDRSGLSGDDLADGVDVPPFVTAMLGGC